MKQIILVIAIFMAFTAYGQMGYQVSLLDTNTGEPRTNEKVNVSIKITDSKGAIICDEQTTATSDAFGVLSLTIGNETTFDNANWQNTPFRITASVDGINIGSSDILNVPIALYARKTGVLSKELLCNKRWSRGYPPAIIFYSDDTCKLDWDDENPTSATYYIDGNIVIIVYRDSDNDKCNYVLHYLTATNSLYGVNSSLDGAIFK